MIFRTTIELYPYFADARDLQMRIAAKKKEREANEETKRVYKQQVNKSFVLLQPCFSDANQLMLLFAKKKNPQDRKSKTTKRSTRTNSSRKSLSIQQTKSKMYFNDFPICR